MPKKANSKKAKAARAKAARAEAAESYSKEAVANRGSLLDGFNNALKTDPKLNFYELSELYNQCCENFELDPNDARKYHPDCAVEVAELFQAFNEAVEKIDPLKIEVYSPLLLPLISNIFAARESAQGNYLAKYPLIGRALYNAIETLLDLYTKERVHEEEDDYNLIELLARIGFFKIPRELSSRIITKLQKDFNLYKKSSLADIDYYLLNVASHLNKLCVYEINDDYHSLLKQIYYATKQAIELEMEAGANIPGNTLQRFLDLSTVVASRSDFKLEILNNHTIRKIAEGRETGKPSKLQTLVASNLARKIAESLPGSKLESDEILTKKPSSWKIKMGEKVVAEVNLEQSCICEVVNADIALTIYDPKGDVAKRFFVEVDGPTHFLIHNQKTGEYCRTGKTMVRNRVREAFKLNTTSIDCPDGNLPDSFDRILTNLVTNAKGEIEQQGVSTENPSEKVMAAGNETGKLDVKTKETKDSYSEKVVAAAANYSGSAEVREDPGEKEYKEQEARETDKGKQKQDEPDKVKAFLDKLSRVIKDPKKLTRRELDIISTLLSELEKHPKLQTEKGNPIFLKEIKEKNEKNKNPNLEVLASLLKIYGFKDDSPSAKPNASALLQLYQERRDLSCFHKAEIPTDKDSCKNYEEVILDLLLHILSFKEHPLKEQAIAHPLIVIAVIKYCRKNNTHANLPAGVSHYRDIIGFLEDINDREGNSKFYLGAFYQLGSYCNITKNINKAFKYYEEAAKREHPDAQFHLGMCYEDGRGVEKNPERAVKLFELAARQGNANAQLRLGIYYTTQKNPQQAVEFFKLAAERGNAKAQFNLWICYANGKGVEENPKQAVNFLKLAAEQGNTDAQVSLGILYATGKWVEEKKPELAVKLFELAARQGNANAQFNLGNCYANGRGVEKNPERAVELFELAAEQGNANAIHNLAAHYINGEGVPEKNIQYATLLLLLAAEKGCKEETSTLEKIENSKNIDSPPGKAPKISNETPTTLQIKGDDKTK